MSLVGLLAAAALSFAVGDLQQSRLAYEQALRLVDNNRLADGCLQAVANVTLERGRSSMVLRGEAPIAADYQRLIGESRQAVDTAIAAMLGKLPPGLREQRQATQESWLRMKALRPVLDASFDLVDAHRPSAIHQQWTASADDLVRNLERLLILLSLSSSNRDAGYVRLSELRIQAFQFRNAIGKQSNTIAGRLFEGGQVSAGDAELLIAERGRAEQILAAMERNVGASGVFELGGEFGKMRARLADQWIPLRDDFLAAARRHESAALPLGGYASAVLPALKSTAEFSDAINRAMASYATEQLDAALRRERLSLASIGAIVLLVSLVAVLVRSRFTRPLNDITNRLELLLSAQGGESATMRKDWGWDEFAHVQAALLLLEKTEQQLVYSSRELDRQNNLLNAVLGSVSVGIVMADALSGKLLLVNPAAIDLLGEGVAVGIPMREILETHSFVRLPDRTPYPREDFPLVLGLQGVSSHAEDILVILPDGRERVLEVTGIPIRDHDGKVWASVVMASDITRQSRERTEMTRLAFHDPLTMLPNRRLFRDRVQMAISLAQRASKRLSLIMIDLDHFKPINDLHGHLMGDELLKAVVLRMLACLRESDTLARIGGDEFVLLLPEINDEQDALGVAEKIRAALCVPFRIDDGLVVSISCSIGVALYPAHGQDEQQLLACADKAMYAAKDSGRNVVQIWSANDVESPSRIPDKETRPLARRLAWHPSFLCGVESIDREHIELFERGNALLALDVSAGESETRALAQLDDLIMALSRHFEREEKILAEVGFAGTEDHRLKHQKLIGQALERRRMTGAGEVAVSALVNYIVHEVLATHILHEDREFEQHLQNIGRRPDFSPLSSTRGEHG